MANTIRGLLPDGTLPSAALAQVQGIVDELDIPEPAVQGVPIFATLAEAQAWEAENPGKVALTLEPSGTDTTPPSWSASLTVKSVGSTQIVINASAAATDDRQVMYEVSQDGMSWAPITPAGLDFTVKGLEMSTSYTLRFRAVDDGGNTSQVLTAPAVTTTTAAPDDYAYQWVAEDFTSGSWPDRVTGAALTGTVPASLVGDEVLFGKTVNGSPGYSTSGLAGGEHRTLMVVARLTSTPDTNLHGFIGQPGPHAIAIPGGGGKKAGWYSTDGTTTKASNVGGNGSVDGGKHVVTVRIDGASSTLTHDRTTVAAVSGPGAVLDTLQVGAGILGYSHQHAVSEIRIYPRRLTDGELTALHSEMGATYGISL